MAGDRRVGFADAVLLAGMREVLGDAVKRIGFLRRTPGSAFDAIARPALATGAASPTGFLDPYASGDDFPLGAAALSVVATGVTVQLAVEMRADLRGPAARFAGGVAASDAIIRNALFDRANAMSDGRDRYDGTRDTDHGLGGDNATPLDANILISDGNWIALLLRRSRLSAEGDGVAWY